MWIYEARPGIVLLSVFATLFVIAYAGYQAGALLKRTHPEAPELHEFVPSTILGLLALILAFTFSMAAGRFENRIQLSVEEANEIGTAMHRASVIRSSRGREIQALLKRYLDTRIESYEIPVDASRSRELDASTLRLEVRIWELARQMTETDRGPIESLLLASLDAAFDIKNTRDFAARVRLPQAILLSILFIAAIGLASFDFRRGQRREPGQWQTAILAFILALTCALIVDLDRPTAGSIRISQDAMTALRDSLGPH